MAFDMGYSAETINSLLDRFINHHKIITYNEQTRELAIKNWGKYNLKRGGKPMLDCVTKELQDVKDTQLIDYVGESVENASIKALYDSYNDTSTIRTTIRGQYKEEEKEEDINNNTLQYSPKRKKRIYDESDSFYKMANYLKTKILDWKPNARLPNNLQSWADDFRKMHELDKRSKEEIKRVIDYATSDVFWQKNILSAKKLREKFDTLDALSMSKPKETVLERKVSFRELEAQINMEAVEGWR